MSRQVVQGPALMVGAPSNAEYGVHIGGSYGQPLQVDATSTDANQWGPVQVQSPFAWSSGGSGGEIYAEVHTSANPYSYSFLGGLYVGAPTIGAGSTVTSLCGVYVQNQGRAGVTNAYGMYLSSQSGASGNNYSLYCSGMANFMSCVGIGIPPSSTYAIGVYIGSGGLSGTNQSSVFIRPQFTNASISGTVQALGIQSFGNYQANTWTTAYGVQIQGPFLYTGSAITTLYGLYVSNQGAAGVTNAYAIYIEAQSAASSANVGLYNAGTTVLIGTVSLPANTVTTPMLAGSITPDKFTPIYYQATLSANITLNSPGPSSTVLCTLTLAAVGIYRIDGEILLFAPSSGGGSTASFQISDDTVGTSLRGGEFSQLANGFRDSVSLSLFYTTTAPNTVIALRACGQIAGWQAFATENIYFNSPATYLMAQRIG